MRAIFFLSFFMFALIIGVRAPFIASLIYVWVDMLAPQSVGYSFITTMPLALISGIASIAFFFLFDKKERVHLGVQWMCMVALTIWITITTATLAELPEFAWVKWDWAFKTMVFCCFMPFVFRTRVRLEALILTMIACVGTVAVSLAIKTFVGGVSYGGTRIWGGVNATSLGESSSFALLAAGLIPFIWVLQKHSLYLPRKKLRQAAIGLIVLFLVAIVGSYARTGLVCIALLAAILFVRTKHKTAVVIGALVLTLVAVPLLPKQWMARMSTIDNTQTEGSSTQRIGVWKWTLDYVAEHPLGGGFDVYRINEISYTAQDPDAPNDPTRSIVLKTKARAFHSNYFELLGEHGWPGLFLYLTIHILALRKCWEVYRAKLPEQHSWLTAYAGANLLMHIMLLIGTSFVGNGFKIFTYLPTVMALTIWHLYRKTQIESGDMVSPAANRGQKNGFKAAPASAFVLK
jgi:probable O-glycosylation ligase (exosortase A-associated)